jgi:hypothetical protein
MVRHSAAFQRYSSTFFKGAFLSVPVASDTELLDAPCRRVTAQVANECVDVAALTFPFDCEQSHLRAALGAGLKIKGRGVVDLVHAHGHAGARPTQAAKTQMTVVTTSATNDNEVEEDGRMRLPEVIGGSAVASLSHRRLRAEPWPVMPSI